MRSRYLWTACFLSLWCRSGIAATPTVLPSGELPTDRRLGDLRNLDGYFPFREVGSVDEWEKRAVELRRQVLVSTGHWPMTTRTPLQAVIHSPVERDDYTVWRVYFQSFPGHYVTGSLYRPKNRPGPRPAVLCPHGHWPNGRFMEYSRQEVADQIAVGAERFEVGGRYPLQARCVQLARMGCVAFHYDMLGYADSVQLEHRSGVRESMNSRNGWGFASPQAELHLQSVCGLQTWNSIRALDLLSELPDVDPNRIAVTGSSGGGTQTFLLMAVDDRPAVGIPCVMVSTAMQGGCNCENAPYLRIGAGNIDLAALTAPRPLAMTAANDWTRELETKGFPDLVNLYGMLGHPDRVRAAFHIHFEHNYNSVNRMFAYGCLNDFLGLGLEKPILERDFVPLSREELTVWSDGHPAPTGDQRGDSHELALLKWWSDDAQQQLVALRVHLAEYRRVVGEAWDTLIGRRLEDVGAIEVAERRAATFGDTAGGLCLINHAAQGEQIPALWLEPITPWNKQAVLWLTDRGKNGLLDEQGAPAAGIRKLLEAGYAVAGVDLLYQGEFLADNTPLSHTRLNMPTENAGKKSEAWKYFSAYTFGYNRPLFAQRVHDVLTTIRAIQSEPLGVRQIHLVGAGQESGAIAIAALAQAPGAISKAAVATGGFRFAAVDRFDHPMFVPGAVKYGDIDGLVQLASETKLLVDEDPSLDHDPRRAVDWLSE